MEDLRGRLDSLPIIVREQTMRQQRLIGRQSMGEFNDKVYETVRRVPAREGCFVWAGGTADRSASQGAIRRVCHARESRPVGLRGSNGDSLPPRGVQGWLACTGLRVRRARRTTGKAYCGGRDVLGRRGASTCGSANGTAGAARARTAAKRLRSQLRRRSISIGPLSWANKQLVLSQLLWQLPYLRCKPSTRALATRRPSQAADIMPPA